MVFLRVLLAFATLIAAVSGAPPSGRSVPQGWSLRRRADPDALLPLKFSLAQSNVEKLEAFLLDIADPHSPNYGKHWSPAKVAETFRPSKQTVDTVHSWLVHDAGVGAHDIGLNANGDVLQLNLTISAAERLLGAEYYVYSDGVDGSERIGCHGGYTLPDHVSKHIDFVWPTLHFGPSSLMRRDGSISDPSRFGRVSGAPKIPVEDVGRALPWPATLYRRILP